MVAAAETGSDRDGSMEINMAPAVAIPRLRFHKCERVECFGNMWHLLKINKFFYIIVRKQECFNRTVGRKSKTVRQNLQKYVICNIRER